MAREGGSVSLGLLMIGDGRDETHERAHESLKRHVLANNTFDQVVTVDDRDHVLGFAGAIQHGWGQLHTDYVLHMEMDFTFNWKVDLASIIQTLEERAYLVQVALLRGPENEAEHAAGGILLQDPDSYEQVECDGRAWIEHRKFFTTNPSVYPAWIYERGWPQVSESEGKFSIALFGEDPVRCGAFWGHGEQWVKHIGAREGRGY